ncbi:DUF6541 family protein [Micromonospora avicenniae]|uniref:DUF6541 family protein n=1 Tax=Micromonospora avicenniae TaxID=1198245 RepID=UPI003430F070
MTSLVALLVAVVPGVLLGFALPPGRYRWAAWAASPALTLGLIAVAMAWLRPLGLPDSAAAVLVAELVLAAAAITLSRLLGRGLVEDGADRGARRWWTRFRLPSVRPRPADVVGLAVPAVIAAGYGWLIVGRLAAPPGWDAMNHGYLSRRILDTGSTAITAACSSGSTDTVTSCEFYPLAANVAWAQATQLSGGPMSTVMTTWALLVGPFALAAGIYACVRALGGRPVVAAAAATAPVFIGPMWVSLLSGRITEQAAPCLAGGLALLIALAVRGRHPVRMGLLAGLGGAGVVMMHSYDVLFIGVLALGLAVALRERLRWRTVGAAAVAMVVAGAGTLAPLLGTIVGAGGERLTEKPQLLGRWGEAVQFWLTDPQRYVLLGFPTPGTEHVAPWPLSVRIGLWITVACLLASPLALVLRSLRWARPWLAAGLVFTLVGIVTISSNAALVQSLAALWYGDPARPWSMIFPVYGVATVAGAVVLGLGLRRLLALLGGRVTALRRPTRALTSGAAVAAVVVLSLALLAAVPGTWHPLRGEVKRRAPVGDSYGRAFEWLDGRVQPGQVVAYDRHRQFMTWSYADYGTPLLFGIPPLEKAVADNWEDRWRAWRWLVNNADAPAAGCAVRRLAIGYVIVGSANYPGWRAHYRQSRLDRSDRLTLVHRVDGIRIYQVTEAGRVCPDPAG